MPPRKNATPTSPTRVAPIAPANPRARTAAAMSTTEQSALPIRSSASLERDPSSQQCIEARYLRLSRPSLT
jgi:hypothetical protein